MLYWAIYKHLKVKLVALHCNLASFSWCVLCAFYGHFWLFHGAFYVPYQTKRKPAHGHGHGGKAKKYFWSKIRNNSVFCFFGSAVYAPWACYMDIRALYITKSPKCALTCQGDLNELGKALSMCGPCAASLPVCMCVRISEFNRGVIDRHVTMAVASLSLLPFAFTFAFALTHTTRRKRLHQRPVQPH